jgi:hypothetical protein
MKIDYVRVDVVQQCPGWTYSERDSRRTTKWFDQPTMPMRAK